jgi:hypothetical protein
MLGFGVWCHCVICLYFKEIQQVAGRTPQGIVMNEMFHQSSNHIVVRDVSVLLEICDQQNKFFGTISVPQGNIAEALMRSGLGKIAPWSIDKCVCASELRLAEVEAKKNRHRLWKDFVTQQTNDFTGKVIITSRRPFIFFIVLVFFFWGGECVFSNSRFDCRLWKLLRETQ